MILGMRDWIDGGYIRHFVRLGGGKEKHFKSPSFKVYHQELSSSGKAYYPEQRRKRYKFPSISFLPILQSRARSRQAIVIGDFVIRGTDCIHK